MSNAGTITTLTNSGAISGGNGGNGGSVQSGFVGGAGGAGGAGVSNAGTITTLTNSGTISGGNGGGGATLAALGSAAGRRGRVERRHDHDADQQRRDQRRDTAPDGGGAGVVNAGTIATLTNSGTISGGDGCNGNAGAGGAWTTRARSRR